MSDYISRKAAVKIAQKYGLANGSALGRHTGLADCIAIEIEGLPAADVEPVRHGRWLDYMCRDWHCSECGEKISKVRNVDGYCYDDKPNYCPNCGAKMELEDNHEN